MTDTAAIGHNLPPQNPFDIVKDKIEGLYDEAKNWLDGEPISSQEQADDLSNLLNMIRTAHKDADEARKEECRPFDEGKAEVQARYAELIADTKSKKGKTVLAMEMIKKALAPWLAKVDAEKRAVAEAARKEAEEKQRAAEEALRASRESDLAEREAAEQKLQEAKQAESLAKRAEKDTAKAKGGIGRAVSLRSVWHAVLMDEKEAVSHYWKTDREEFLALLNRLAERDVRNGKHSIPGFNVLEDRVAV